MGHCGNSHTLETGKCHKQAPSLLPEPRFHTGSTPQGEGPVMDPVGQRTPVGLGSDANAGSAQKRLLPRLCGPCREALVCREV